MSIISAQMASRLGSFRSPEDEDKGVTIRSPASSLFCIDSSDRYKSIEAERSGTVSPYNFTISKNESLLNGFFSRIGLTEIVFPFYIPNVNQKTNKLSYISSIIGNGEITLGTGFYTPSQLAAAVQAALIADGVVGITVQYVDGSFYVDAGVGNTISFFPNTFIPPGPRNTDFQLFDMMGFTVVNQAAARYQTSAVTRCRYTEYIDIVCSQLTYNQDLKDGSSDPIVRDMIARIYLEAENDQPIGVYTTLAAANPTTVPNTVPGTYQIGRAHV